MSSADCSAAEDTVCNFRYKQSLSVQHAQAAVVVAAVSLTARPTKPTAHEAPPCTISGMSISTNDSRVIEWPARLVLQDRKVLKLDSSIACHPPFFLGCKRSRYPRNVAAVLCVKFGVHPEQITTQQKHKTYFGVCWIYVSISGAPQLCTVATRQVVRS